LNKYKAGVPHGAVYCGRVGQYLGYETFELQQFFLGHAMFLVNDQRDAACVEHGRALAGLCRV